MKYDSCLKFSGRPLTLLHGSKFQNRTLESFMTLLCEYMGELHEATEKENEHPEEKKKEF